MILHKIQVSSDTDKKAGIQYVEFASESVKNVEAAMVECAKYVPNDVHVLATIPIWEKVCRENATEFNLKFRFDLRGLVFNLTSKIYRYVFSKIPFEKYLEIYGVKKND